MAPSPSAGTGRTDTTDVEIIATAWSLRRKLLLRAFELTGNVADAEDLVSDVFEALIRRPPKDPGTPARLHHWLRTVLLRRRDDRLRRLYAGTADALAYATEDIESADAEVVTVI